MSTTDIERLRYYQHQYLGALDFEAQQAYHRDMRRRHSLAHHTWGIAVGLELVDGPDSSGDAVVYVLPGMAVDGYGREILLLQSHRLDREAFEGRPTGDRAVYIAYNEERTGDPAAGYELCDEPEQERRIRETYRVLIDPDPLRDQIVVDGKRLDPPSQPQAPTAGQLSLPLDGSVPYQELPETNDPNTWLVRLGSVAWDATGGGEFVTPAAKNENRSYIGLVGETLLAPGRSIRIRERAKLPELDPSRDTQFAAVEGTLRVDGLLTARDSVQLDDGIVDFRDGFGAGAPKLHLYRQEDEGLRVRLGDEKQGKLSFRIGIKDDADYAAGFIVNDKGEVQLNRLLTIRTEDGLNTPPVQLERVSGLRLVISDTNQGTNKLTVGPLIPGGGGGNFEAKLTVEDDGDVTIAGNTAIVGDTTIGAGGNATLRVRHIEGKDYQSDAPDKLYVNWQSGEDVVVGNQSGPRSGLFVSGDATIGSGGDGVLRSRHVRGKKTTDDTDDGLFLNWDTGQDVHVGRAGGTTSGLLVSGKAIVGAGGDAALQTRHVQGKASGNDNLDALYLNYNTGGAVHVGAIDGTPSSLHVSGNAVVGSGGNGSLRVRHVDGKNYVDDSLDDLYLNWNTGRDVHVGSSGSPADLEVSGTVTLNNSLVIRNAAGLDNTDSLSIERFERGNDLTDLRVVIGDNDGGDDRLVVGPRRWQDQQFAERFVVKNNGEVEVGSTLRVRGSRTALLGLDGANMHWFMVGGETEGFHNAFGFNGAQRQVVSGWTKAFLIDHPLDRKKSLLHATLEGPEAAVFYRGEARLADGRATVELPRYFEALTREQARTVQLTPKLDGAEPVSVLAASGVQDGRFEVAGADDRNPEQAFYWEVKAVRADVAELEIEPDRT